MLSSQAVVEQKHEVEAEKLIRCGPGQFYRFPQTAPTVLAKSTIIVLGFVLRRLSRVVFIALCGPDLCLLRQ